MSDLPSGSDFGQLRAFVAVGETLSFSRAAGTLGVTPSALSQTLRALETRLGVRLLNRTTRSVSLTDAGQTLLHRVAPAVAELSGALGQARQSAGRVSGVVRVHAFRSAADQLIAPMLPTFIAAHPDVVVDLVQDDTVVDLVAAGYDLGVRLGEVIERDMVAVRLGPDLRQLAVASPSYLAAHEPPRHPRDLVAHRCIRWRWPGTANPYNWEFFEDGRWFEVVVDGPLIVNTKELAIRAAEAGAGIAFAPDYALRTPLAEGRLLVLLEPWSGFFPGYHLCYPQQRQMAPAVRAFIDALKAHSGGVG